MKRFLTVGLMVCLLAGVLCLAPVRAEALTFSDLTTIYETELVPIGNVIIDGVDFLYSNVGGLVFIEAQTAAGPTVIYDGPHNKELELQLIAQFLGIPMFSAGSVTSPESAAQATATLVFENLVVPTVAPKSEQKKIEDQKKMGATRVFGGKISVDWVDDDGADDKGNVYNFSVGFAQDMDNVTVGVIVPYDRFDFDLWKGNRIGIVPFAQYRLDVSEALQATLAANLNFMYSDYQLDSGIDEDINTYGGGLSAGLHYKQENYEAGCGISWQYNEDNVDMEDDHQHLIKVGANIGLHLTENQVINLFGVWNQDITDYDVVECDEDSFDVGAEYRADFSGTWMINVGYKKIISLEDYDSDMIYIGSNWLF